MTYAAAGVDLAAAEDNVRRIARHVRSTHGPSVLGNFGAFAGLFHLQGVRDPVLVASTDGVGSKVLLGAQLGRYDVLGRDLVNLSVNDVLTVGARPLFFLDYVGVHAIDPAVMDALVSGIAAACRDNGCALLGGETAQLADLYAPGRLDLAGTVVGVVERGAEIDGSRVEPGDRVWGLPSTGLHTNGFSLARQVVAGLDLASDPGGQLGQPLGQALLAPHPSYYPPVARLLPKLKAIAHITGGGIPGNLARVLSEHCDAVVDRSSWEAPRIFQEIKQVGDIDDDEMEKVFNLGVGMILVVPADDVYRAIDVLRGQGHAARQIGVVDPRQAERVVFRR